MHILKRGQVDERERRECIVINIRCDTGKHSIICYHANAYQICGDITMRVVLTGRHDTIRTIAARYYDNRGIEGVVKMLLRANPCITCEYADLVRSTALTLPDYVTETHLNNQ